MPKLSVSKSVDVYLGLVNTYGRHNEHAVIDALIRHPNGTYVPVTYPLETKGRDWRTEERKKLIARLEAEGKVVKGTNKLFELRSQLFESAWEPGDAVTHTDLNTTASTAFDLFTGRFMYLGSQLMTPVEVGKTSYSYLKEAVAEGKLRFAKRKIAEAA